MAERAAGRLPGAHTQAVRALRVFRALAAKPIGYQLEQLAQEHGVSTRTMRRDIAALRAAGFEVSVFESQVQLHR